MNLKSNTGVIAKNKDIALELFNNRVAQYIKEDVEDYKIKRQLYNDYYEIYLDNEMYSEDLYTIEELVDFDIVDKDTIIISPTHIDYEEINEIYNESIDLYRHELKSGNRYFKILSEYEGYFLVHF